MQLVILAAGHGRRFGGLKQLAPVGPNGEAIMDYTALAAYASGFDGVVLVVRPEIAQSIGDHVASSWPSELRVELVNQASVPGTAQAVLSARSVIDGPFAVANADDLYGIEAMAYLARHLSISNDGTQATHLLVAYDLLQTVLTRAPVTRGLCEVSPLSHLARITEHTVALRPDGRFQATALDAVGRGATPKVLSGTEPVSMNLWGFELSMLAALEAAVSTFDPSAGPHRELLLPDVVESLIASGQAQVRVEKTSERCIGITHPDDIALVSDELTNTPSASVEKSSRPG